MREIKYRVWCKNKNEWEKDLIAILPSGALLHHIGHSSYRPCSRDSHIVVFYTGLKDRNGVDIYDGDLLSGIDPNGETIPMFEVEFDHGIGMWIFYDDFDGYDYTSIHCAAEMGYEFEIFGNVYENPDLINEA